MHSEKQEPSRAAKPPPEHEVTTVSTIRKFMIGLSGSLSQALFSYRATVSPGKERNLENREKSCGTYLGLLPEEAAEKIIRQVSSAPRILKWREYVEPSDMFTLFKCDCVISYTAKKLLYKLDTSRKSRSPNTYSAKNAEHDHLLLNELLSEGAQAFTDLVIVNTIRFSRCVQSFPNLKILSISGYQFHLALNATLLTGCKLHTLKLRGESLWKNDVLSIVSHCTDLKCLHLRFAYIPSYLLKTLFGGIGFGLHELHLETFQCGINGQDETGDVLKNWIVFSLQELARFCHNIRSIAFKGCNMFRYTAEYTALCAWYGSQLESLYLQQCAVPTMFLHDIVLFCTEVTLRGDAVECGLEMLSVMGPRVGEVVLLPRFDEVDDARLKSIASHCLNLRKIRIEPPSCNIFDLFSYPELRLHDVTIANSLRVCNASVIFQALAKTKSIRILHYYGPMPSDDSFHNFASENQELQGIEIRRMDDRPSCACGSAIEAGPVPVWVSTVKTLAGCPRLQNVILQCGKFHFNSTFKSSSYPPHQELCDAFRSHHNFSALICGWWYIL